MNTATPDWRAQELRRDAAHYERMCVSDDALARAEQALEVDFLRACRAGDANAIARWAPTVIDFKVPYAIDSKAPRPRRVQTLDEVMRDALDYLDAETELFQLVLNVAQGADMKAAATSLIERLAREFATRNAEVCDD